MDASDRIMQATLRLVETTGVHGVTVSTVADLSGVSRQTVYTHFGSREQLVSQALQQVAATMLQVISAQVAGITSAADFVVEIIVSVRTQLKKQPALSMMAFSRAGGSLVDQQLFDEAALPMTRQFLAPLLGLAPELAADFDEVCETCLRVGLSILLFDSPLTHSDDDLRGFLRRRLLPGLGLG